MNKLHLIKPWRLRAVRQRLENIHYHPTASMLIAPVACPQAGEEAAAGRWTDGRSEARKTVAALNAPSAVTVALGVR